MPHAAVEFSRAGALGLVGHLPPLRVVEIRFHARILVAAREEARERGITNSVASCTLMAELGGREMHIVPGSEKNIKVTTVEDLEILKALMHVEKESWLK